MANLIATQSHDFADRKVLAEKKTRFCIQDAELVTQKDGKVRWYLTIHRGDDKGYGVTERLTFDRSKSRDTMFEGLIKQGDWPQHNCWLNLRSFKASGGTQTFYALVQDGEYHLCACGLKAEPAPTPEEDGPENIPPPEEELEVEYPF